VLKNKGSACQKEGQETKRDLEDCGKRGPSLPSAAKRQKEIHKSAAKTGPTQALLFRLLWTLEHANTEFRLNRDDHG
jgi:hypothetical protein